MFSRLYKWMILVQILRPYKKYLPLLWKIILLENVKIDSLRKLGVLMRDCYQISFRYSDYFLCLFSLPANYQTQLFPLQGNEISTNSDNSKNNHCDTQCSWIEVVPIFLWLAIKLSIITCFLNLTNLLKFSTFDSQSCSPCKWFLVCCNDICYDMIYCGNSQPSLNKYRKYKQHQHPPPT